MRQERVALALVLTTLSVVGLRGQAVEKHAYPEDAKEASRASSQQNGGEDAEGQGQREKGPSGPTSSDRPQDGKIQKAEEAKPEPPVTVGYGSKGFKIATQDGRFETNIQWRAQLRYFYPFDVDPDEPDEFDALGSSTFRISRARLKVGGHAFRSWLKYYTQFDLRNSRLLDLQITLAKHSWLQLRVGQFKAPYNRERVDSSGKQQFVERSIVNRVFTVDRQQGASLFGHLMPGTPGDSRYFTGVFTGTGRGGGPNEGGRMMWVGRYQWNFLGRDLPFSQTDVEYRKKPAGSLAFAGATHRSRFTRFSSGGGGQLLGFEEGAPGQYSIGQMTGEAAFKYRGFSLQHEYHWKRINDNVNGTRTVLRGSYIQTGYFPHGLIASLPKPLEVTFRFAFVDRNDAPPIDFLREYTFGLNWFFVQHRNKLTFDVSRIILEQAGGSDRSDVRVRFQWDVSF